MSNQVIYDPNGGASSPNGGIDDFSVVPISIERKAVAPLSQGIAVGMPQDDGRNRNRVDLEHTEYGNRIVALTLVQSGPVTAGIVRHIPWENAQDKTVAVGGQQPPLYVDNATQLPYIYPANTREGVWVGPDIYEPA